MALLDDLLNPRPDTFVSFIRAWRGEAGLSASELDGIRMPPLLRRYLGIAGRLPSAFLHLKAPHDYASVALPDGRIVFIVEEQGVFSFATEPDGDDPPVWIEHDDADWVREGERLGRFLLQHAIAEAAATSPTCGWGRVAAAALPVVLDALPKLPLAPWHHPTGPLSFHAAERLLALVFDDDQGESFEVHVAMRGDAVLPRSLLEAVAWHGDPPGCS